MQKIHRLIRNVCAVFIPLLFSVCFADLGDRSNLTIRTIHPMSVERLHCPECTGITRIYVNPGAWGATECREDAADIYANDEHMLSIVMTAWAMGKQIRFEVNDQHPTLNGVCRATALFVS